MEQLRSVGGAEIGIHEEYLRAAERHPRLADRLCKACGKPGVRVLPVTIATHVDARYWHLLSDGPFFFSLTPDCAVTYFNNRTGIYFLKNEIKTRFGPKEKDPPRPICYCLQVTEERIADEILRKRCCDSLQDIEAYTRAGTGKWCLTTNPSGKCCREYLPEVVEKYLALAKDEVVEELKKLQFRIEEEERRIIELEVRGMTCEGCVAAVKSIIENMGGIDVSVSLRDGEATAAIPASLTPEEVARAISDSGYEAYVKRTDGDKAPR